jgi:hypothetical protein
LSNSGSPPAEPEVYVGGIKHARELTLKVNKEFVEILDNIRQKSYEASLE